MFGDLADWLSIKKLLEIGIIIIVKVKYGMDVSTIKIESIGD